MLTMGPGIGVRADVGTGCRCVFECGPFPDVPLRGIGGGVVAESGVVSGSDGTGLTGWVPVGALWSCGNDVFGYLTPCGGVSILRFVTRAVPVGGLRKRCLSNIWPQGVRVPVLCHLVHWYFWRGGLRFRVGERCL